MGWKVLIAPSARDDLRDIVTFVALHNPEAAERLGFQLIALAESLAPFPRKGRVIPEYSSDHLREILCRSYRILYRVNDSSERIEIIRFWHASRGFPLIPRMAV